MTGLTSDLWSQNSNGQHGQITVPYLPCKCMLTFHIITFYLLSPQIFSRSSFMSSTSANDFMEDNMDLDETTCFSHYHFYHSTSTYTHPANGQSFAWAGLLTEGVITLFLKHPSLYFWVFPLAFLASTSLIASVKPLFFWLYLTKPLTTRSTVISLLLSSDISAILKFQLS
jgi:hypothetical protein